MNHQALVDGEGKGYLTTYAEALAKIPRILGTERYSLIRVFIALLHT